MEVCGGLWRPVWRDDQGCEHEHATADQRCPVLCSHGGNSERGHEQEDVRQHLAERKRERIREREREKLEFEIEVRVGVREIALK